MLLNSAEKITDVIRTITSDILNNIWAEIEYRFDIVIATDGAHVEVYYIKLFELLYRIPQTTRLHQSQLPYKLIC
jgi:hypothetical protein